MAPNIPFLLVSIAGKVNASSSYLYRVPHFYCRKQRGTSGSRRIKQFEPRHDLGLNDKVIMKGRKEFYLSAVYITTSHFQQFTREYAWEPHAHPLSRNKYISNFPATLLLMLFILHLTHNCD